MESGLKVPFSWRQATFILFYVLSGCLGSHFRGGIIMWKPTNTDNQVVINFRVSWRKSYSYRTGCDNDIIAAGSSIGPSSEYMTCFSGCSGRITSMDYKCTDFSDGEDWSAGENSYTFSFPETDDRYYQFGFTGGDWISLVKGGGSWEMRTTANLTRRADTGTVNSSPASAMTPIVRIQHGCNATIEIPVNDKDGDEVRCRWSESTKHECAGVCDAFPGAVLDQRRCKIFYSATGSTGWYAVAVQIEDFAKTTDTEPQSSVPLQFLVQVFQSDSPCTSKPEFVDPTRVDTSCVGVPFNTTYFEPIIARSGADDISITEINTVSPVGVTKSDLAQYADSSRDWYVNITWSPTVEQAGANIFCYSAVDSAGLTSDQSCITLLGGVQPPEVVNGSQSPTGDILPTHSTWSVAFDLQFVQPKRPTFVYFYKTDGSLAHKVDVATVTGYPQGSLSRTISIDPKFSFTEKEYYYVLLDPGVARGTTYCGAESSAIRDPTWWTVRIRDITPPRLQFQQALDITNANVTIKWSFDEEVTTKCTIQTPTYDFMAPCNDTWTGTDLAEGYYTIYIQGTDIEHNAAEPVRHTWRVDGTAPELSVITTPELISNETSFVFQFRCNEDCFTECRLYLKGTQTGSFNPCDSRSRYTKRFSTGSLSTDAVYVFEVVATDIVDNQGAIQSFEWLTDFVAPVIQPMSIETVTCGDDYSPNVTGVPTVTDNLDTTPLVMFGDRSSGECGVFRVWNATDDAGNTAYMNQEIMFTSPREATVKFPDDAIVPCGDLQQVTEDSMLSAIKVEHPCGLPVNITYTDPSEAGRCEVTFTRQWLVTDDCGGQVSYSQQIQILKLQIPDTPQNGQTNIDLQYTLRWPVYPGSVSYKVYIWYTDERKPSQPVAITSNPEYTLPAGLRPGTQISWQIEYVLDNNKTVPSPHWGFETRKYPDVAVESITVPPIAFSGQSFDVRWTVRNIGNLTTQATRWYDAVYVSFTEDFSRARRASVVRTNNILFPNDGYMGQATITLKENDIGQMYVFVKTDVYNYISDVDRSNNLLKAEDIMEAKLTPPPDLRVDMVTIPSSSYSGSEISISFTIKNNGTGATTVNSWYDRVLWSADPFYNSSDVMFTEFRRTSGLTQNEDYTSQVKVVVPREIYGEFYILIQTDVYNNVFEHTADDNNLGISNAINVILSPPPDLKPIYLQVGESYTTGDSVHITWEVENDGDAPYKHTWFDRVVLESLDGVVSEVLHTSTFSGKFSYGETYTRSFTYIVSPTIPAGRYNITLHIDYREDIFEFDKKGNNIIAKLITIYQALPDLAVEEVAGTVNSSQAGNELQVTWKVTNVGPGRTIENSWRDVISVKPENGNLFRELVYDWTVKLNKSLNVNDIYGLVHTIRLPLTVYGNILITVKTDKYGRTADKGRANNIRQTAAINVPLRAHDLEVEQLEWVGSGEIYSGSIVMVKWNVRNIGVHIPQGSFWEEQILLSPSSSSFLPTFASVEAKHEGPLNNGDTYESNSTFNIPESVVGDLYLHILLDPKHRVFEGPNVSNNNKYVELIIQNPPSPDFTVTNVDATLLPTASSSQKVLSVSWTVANNGNSMKFLKKWTDSVYLGPIKGLNTVLGIDKLYKLESFEVNAALSAQQFYRMMKNILLPQNLIGKYFVYVGTDSKNSVIELNAEGNNIAYSEFDIEITPPPTSELSVTINSIGLSSSVAATSGKETWISFEVTNSGEIQTSVSSWNDVVYLLNIANAGKETVIENGIKIATVGHVGILKPLEKYVMNVSVTIPRGFSGDAYFYVLADVTSDEDKSTAKGGYATSAKFEAAQGYLPNLLPIVDTVITQQRGGEPYLFQYNVTNNGEEIASGQRYDAVYLSDDIVLDPFDRKLDTKLFITQLDINDTTSCSISVFLPFDLQSKNYFLILVLDLRNEIYESNENDNTAKLALTIIEKVSTDIVVLDVEAPSKVSFGNNIEIGWKIRNNGSQKATGYKCDTAYISDDNKWDITDEQIGKTVCGYITINPYQSSADDKPAKVTAGVPLVADDSYTAIVKSRSNILDNYLENNIGIAETPTSISIETINLDSSVSFSFKPNEEKAFRIPNVPAEEALIVSVRGNDQNNFNEVRVRFKKPATKFNFDTTTSDPFLTNQIVVVPNTKYGDYYIHIDFSGSLSRNPSTSRLTVEVRLAKFEILRTSPAKASPLGNVTVKFEGTLFPEDVTAMLSNTNQDIHALDLFRFSSTLAYATFDMTVATVGKTFTAYLSSEYLNLTVSQVDVLEMIEGIPGRAKASLSLPAALRPGERGFVYVDIQNEGDTDITAPIVTVSTNAIGHLKFITTLKATDYLQRYVMIASPSDGPGGILPPKQYSRLIFDAKQIDPDVIGRVKMSVSIIEPDKTKEHDYIKMKDNLKFSHYDSEAWDKVWTNFIGYAGSTWFSLSRKVSEISTQMSVVGRRVHELSEFVIFLLDMSDGPKGDNFISMTSDLLLDSTEAPHVGLELKRYVSPKVGLRSMNGFFGKGWITPLWDTKLVAISPEIARLRVDKVDFLFTSSSMGVYENDALGRMVLRNSGCYYVDKTGEKEYRYNLSTGMLLSLMSDRDRSYVYFNYNSNNKITKMLHSSGAYADIAYDENDRITTASLKNSTVAKEQTTIYSYDPTDNHLVSVTIDGETTTYEYYPDGSLKSVIYSDGRREEFLYTSNGHLQSRAVVERGVKMAEMQYDYDGNAKVTRTITPDDVLVTYTYDELGNKAAAHRKGGITERFINTVNTRSVYEGDSVVTYERYDRNRNSVYLEDGNGDSLEIEYDRLGQVKALVDGGGNVYSIERNRNGTLKRSVFPDTSEENYTYRPNGLDVNTRTGVTKQFNYDNDGRVVWKDSGSDDVTSYQYDNSGNMIAASSKIGKVSFSYNDDSVLQSVQYPGNISLNYKFTDKGLKSTLSSNSLGYNVKYVYNDRGLLIEVRDQESGTVLMQADYFSTGKLKQKTLGNGAYTRYFYQKDSGLLKGQYNFYPNDTLSSKFEYVYDTRERRITMRSQEGEWRFRYDTSGQLTYIKRPNGHETMYSYDRRKNRKTVTINGNSKLYKTNNMNQYTDYDGDQVFSHDKNGNLRQITGTKSRGYTFDEENKLVEFETPDTDCILMYDGIDSIHKKKCQAETVQYLVDPFGKNGPDILAEISSSGVGKSFYHGGDQLGLVAMKTGGEFYYYQFDPLGSVVSLLSKDGGLLNSYKMDPFGEIIEEQETITNPFKFIGQWGVMSFREIPELYYMRARFYDAQHGRFLSLDPLGIAGKSKNFYVYAYNNPVHFNDPRGTFAPWLAMGLINTVVYAGFQLATGGDVTLGGAASAFVTGAIGGFGAGAITKVTAGIGSKLATYYAKAHFYVSLNTFGNIAGAVVEHVTNNIFGDKPFDGTAFGTNMMNGVVQAFIPGNLPRTVSSALSNAGTFLLDPTKSISEKWQQVKDTWKNGYNKAREAFNKAKDFVKDAYEKVKDTAQKQWDDIKGYVDDLKDKVGDKWQDVKEDLRNKLDDIKEDVKEKWDDIKDEVSDQWDNLKDEVKEKWEDVKDKVEESWDDLKDEVSDRWDDLKDKAREEFDDFKDKINEKWDDIKDKVSDTVDKTMDDLSDAYDKLKDKVNDLADDFKDAVDDLVDDAKDAWEDFKDNLGDLGDGIMDWIRSRDPNDIIGPVGYGAARFIAKTTRLNYKIRFENDANATAPAQRVFIEHIFDLDLNPRAFRIGSFGFGNYTHELEMDRSYLQTSINLTEEFGIFLQVRGGLDIVNGRATWEFQSIDPDTGSPPSDPRVGFLPPNNGTTGQGYVTFSIAAQKESPSLARIDATATIYFDQNEPIETPPIFNTIDDSAPSVNASVLYDTLLSGSLALALDSFDVGAGLKDVNILIKEGLGYTTLLAGVNESAVTLPLSPGGTYDLVFSPVDHVGNRQELEESIQTSRLQVYFPDVELTCSGVSNCSGNGNCTGQDICVCNDGFYGADCSSSTPPAEPPVLELMSPGGFEDEDIQLYVLAKLVDGTTPDGLSVTIDGFPNGTTFTKGSLENSKLTVQSSDFGNINASFPRDFAENVSLSARALYSGENIQVSRSGSIKIAIIPVTDNFTLSVTTDCYDDRSSSYELKFRVLVTTSDEDLSEIVSVTVELPRSYKLGQGQFLSNGRYILNQTEVLSTLTIIFPSNHTFVPFDIKVSAAVYDIAQPDVFMRMSMDTTVKLCQDTSSTPSSVTTVSPESSAGSVTGRTSTEAEPGEADKKTNNTTVIVIGSVVGAIVVIAVVAIVVKVCLARRAGAGLGNQGYRMDTF